jgi:transposase-like protein
MANKGSAMNLIAIYKTFGTTEACLNYLEVARWPEGVRCLVCGDKNVSKFVTNETIREDCDDEGNVTKTSRVPARHLYQCNESTCRFQFSATSGTIFDKSHLPLPVWFQAVALIINAKKGLSAKQMQRDLGVNYRTAWFLNHRIREAMKDESGGLFTGTVEIDCTFVGGKFDKRRKRQRWDKPAVAGVMQRGIEENGPSKIRTFRVAGETHKAMMPVIDHNVAKDALVYTDSARVYMKLGNSRSHEVVNHNDGEYVRGTVHTNSVEGFWSLFKRGVIGSFHQVSIKHLHRYLNEFSFRFNNRENEELFALLITNLVAGKALRYRMLTSNDGVTETQDEPF